MKLRAVKTGQYVQVRLSLNPAYVTRLEMLRRKRGLSTYAEVVRAALAQFEKIESALDPGDKICIEHGNGIRTYIAR